MVTVSGLLKIAPAATTIKQNPMKLYCYKSSTKRLKMEKAVKLTFFKEVTMSYPCVSVFNITEKCVLENLKIPFIFYNAPIPRGFAPWTPNRAFTWSNCRP
jgi:hypothetical protein